MEEIRKQLQGAIPYEKGVKLRKQLHEDAMDKYHQKYSDSQHVDFMERHAVSFRVNHPQESNYPYYYTMFSILTQHISGDCIRELLDKAIDIENERIYLDLCLASKIK